MRKKLAILFSVLLVSAIVSAGIITSSANDENTATAKTYSTSNDETSKATDYNYTQALNELSNTTPKITINEIPVEKLSPKTKQDYYHKMLNTIDYYNTVSGSFKTNYLDNDSTDETVVSYQVDMINNLSQETVKGSCNDSEIYASNNRLVYVNNSNKSITTSNQIFTKVDELAGYNSYVMQTQNDVKKAKTEFNKIFDDDNRVTVDENGDKHYLNRLNSTNLCISASYSLLPQGLTFGYLSNQDMWEIGDDTEYLGRDAVVITGKAGDYGKKFNTATFEMIVDKETGILLELQGYDENGNSSKYIKTTEISFEQPDVKTYSPSEYTNYQKLVQ